MKIAIAQMNPKVGDFEGNTARILELARQAWSKGARMTVFPELAICGYPPLDLLKFPAFLDLNTQALEALAAGLPQEMAVVVGYVRSCEHPIEKELENAAAVLLGGKVVFSQSKTLLPTYDVFDEDRYFAPSQSRKVWTWEGIRFGIAICEDLWWEISKREGVPYGVDPVKDLADAGAQILISPSSSPFIPGKQETRLGIMRTIGEKYSMAVVYANQVGGNDGLIFDGNSMVTDRKGSLQLRGASFKEDLIFWDTEAAVPEVVLKIDPLQDLEEALILGTRDYLRKCGFKKAHLGLSGGIDSALVAYIAVKALGAENVRGFAMPGRYSSQGSLDDAKALADNLGIPLDTISIEGPFQAYLDALAPVFQGSPEDVTEENLQARIRGMYLMAISNKTGSILLTTGNKSELAVGYCTLYGDMNGGLAVIGDVFKTEVYRLCEYINRQGEIIPWNTIRKAPSAELRPGQTDQDSLPPYPVLDRILSLYLLDHQVESQIIAQGLDPDTVKRVLRLTALAEYKRWQAPPVLKVSPLAFGTGRRFPLARGVFEVVINKK